MLLAPYHRPLAARVTDYPSQGTATGRAHPHGYHESVRRQFSQTFSGLDGPSWAAIGVAVVVLLIIFARLLGSAAFLWVALTGAPFLLGYARLETRGFLLIGAVLVGSGVGILFEANLAWEGAYLASVGAALAAAEGIHPTPGRLALLLGAILAGLGVLLGVAAAGPGPLVAFALLALLGGLVYLRTRHERERQPGLVR